MKKIIITGETDPTRELNTMNMIADCMSYFNEIDQAPATLIYTGESNYTAETIRAYARINSQPMIQDTSPPERRRKQETYAQFLIVIGYPAGLTRIMRERTKYTALAERTIQILPETDPNPEKPPPPGRKRRATPHRRKRLTR